MIKGRAAAFRVRCCLGDRCKADAVLSAGNADRGVLDVPAWGLVKGKGQERLDLRQRGHWANWEAGIDGSVLRLPPRQGAAIGALPVETTQVAEGSEGKAAGNQALPADLS